jgi:hypothetical protein
LTYTPSNNVTGADSFNFVVSDGQFNSAPAVVALWINEASNSLPSVSLISPANNSWVVAPTNLTIEVNGSDTDGIYAVELFEGTNGLTALLTPPFTYTWNVRTQGVYHLFARAIDPLNNRRFSDPVTIRALGAMPKISIRPATNGPLQVAWPLSVGGAVLEESTNLVSWTLVTNTLVDTATERTHTVAPTQRRYFRFSVW